ncbi:MAG: 23S rRNA (adenine(2030)-N(6))-methyltransferase RlmJ, partial [Planctomycetota bacterium]|nr:23S rRNA (adenine(2030)-N(6))-methyltransferase RlmJ [Planctomycetota bacterium]
MRIISGTARGVGLEVAKGSSSRPFLEMARGGIFNSLGGLVIGARVLDLYAGSGSLGLEALSRGADACLFVERDPLAFAALLRNIGRCRMGRIARAECAEAGFFLRGAVGAYGLIFVDPPFSICREWTGGGGSGD